MGGRARPTAAEHGTAFRMHACSKQMLPRQPRRTIKQPAERTRLPGQKQHCSATVCPTAFRSALRQHQLTTNACFRGTRVCMHDTTPLYLHDCLCVSEATVTRSLSTGMRDY